MTYHEKLSEEMQDLLKKNTDPTSLYVRGRQDKIAVHKIIPNLSMLIECKTNDSSQHRNMSLEFLPFLHYLSASKLGVQTLYAYYDPFIDHHCGFFIHDYPFISRCFITKKDGDKKILLKNAAKYLNISKITQDFQSGGSNDSFIIISKNAIEKLPHWKQCIDRTITVRINDNQT